MKNKENLRHFTTQPQRPIDFRESLGKFHDFARRENRFFVCQHRKKVSEGNIKCVKLSFHSVQMGLFVGRVAFLQVDLKCQQMQIHSNPRRKENIFRVNNL